MFTFLQMKSSEAGGRADVKVMYKMADCTGGTGYMCIKSVFLTYKHEEQQNYINVALFDDFTALIKGTTYNLAQYPFHSKFLYVKKATSLFVIIRGFGFKILYSPLGRLYLKFDPFYKNKVNLLYYGLNVCVSESNQFKIDSEYCF